MELKWRRVAAIAVAPLLTVGVAGAQVADAPVVRSVVPTPADDSIYKLVVDPRTHDDEATHILLDEAVVRVEGDEHVSHHARSVVQVITDAGATQLREQQLSYAPGHQKLTINWVRVVRPDGSVVSGAPTQVQVADVPAPVSSSPIYTDRKLVRLSLTGVEPGVIVDMSFTLDETKTPMPHDFVESWRVTPGGTVERSRMLLDVPESVKPRIKEQNLDFKPTITTTSGRTVYTWTRNETPKIRFEPFASDSDGVVMRVSVTGPITWSDVSHWYAGLARDRYVPSARLTRLVDSLVAKARTRDDSIRAVHKWVAQDIRYVGIELGVGGYQPRMPDTVVVTGFGDCKDKATLFVTALGAIGIKAYPVLLSSNATAKRDMPTPEQFNHEIAAVPLASGGYQFVDLTSAYSAYGELPFSEQGGFGLVVFPDGKNEEVTLPLDPPTANVTTTRLVGTLSPDGTFTGHYQETMDGSVRAVLRNAFHAPLDSAQRANVARSLARRYFPSSEGDSLVGFNGSDYTAPVAVSVRITDAKATTSAGPVMMLNNPFASLGSMTAAAEDMAKLPQRRFPIDASKIFGRQTSVTELRLTLPQGWHAKLPADVQATSEFGSYTAHFAQEGRDLVMTRRMVGAVGVYPPSKLPDLLAWLRALGKDDSKFIVLDKAGAE